MIKVVNKIFIIALIQCIQILRRLIMNQNDMYLKKINDITMEVYQKNMQYLRNNHSDIFEKVSLLELAIQDEMYSPKFELEFKKDYFDIYDVDNSTFVYNQNSYKYSEKLSDSITFDNKENNFNAYRYYNFNDTDTQKLSNMDVSLSVHTAYAPIINYIANNIPEVKRDLKTINKFIFLGTGLGLQITEILKKTNAKICLIVENDLELFRLSLFVTKYSDLANHTQLLFSVADSDNVFLSRCSSFLLEQYIYNNNIKFNVFSESHKDRLSIIQSNIVSQAHMSYDYSRHFLRTLRPLDYWCEKANFLDVSQYFNTNKFEDKPMLIIGAGPSLTRNLKWLKKNHGRFVVVAVYATLPFLYKHKIKPDIVVHIDENHKANLPVISKIDINFFKDAKFLFSAITHNEILRNFDKKNIFMMQAVCEHNNLIGQIFAPSVGEVAYNIALLSQANDIYLLGIDLSLDPLTNASHASFHEHESLNEDFDETKDKESEKGNLDKTYIKIKGNLRDVVYTTPRFQLSISQINHVTNVLKQKTQNVYNLNDGAFFEDIIPLNIDKLDIKKYKKIDKDLLKESITDIFINKSTNKLTEFDLKMLKLKLQNAKNIEKLINVYQKKKYIQFNDFLFATVLLINDITKQDGNTNSKELNEIYSEYFKLTSHFIFEFFNTKDLEDESKHIQEIKKIFETQLYRLSNKYISEIKGYYKKLK